MDAQNAIDVGREAIRACLMIGGPILLVSLLIGLLLGIVQAMTQVQDQTVSFVPKALIVMLMIGLGLPWLSDRMLDFSRSVLSKPLLMAGTSNRWTAPDATDQDAEQPTAFKIAGQPSSIPASFFPASFSRTPQKAAKQSLPSSLVPGQWPVEKVAERNSPFVLPSHRYSRSDDSKKIPVPALLKPDARSSKKTFSPFVLPRARVAEHVGDDLEG